LQPNVHELEAQTGYPLAGAGTQVTPQPPQFGSWVGFTQVLPHLIRPELQVKPQVPPVQEACPPVGAEQTLPQAPQFCGSEPVATH